MEIDEDTCDWLGLPTPLEMYKHHCSMIEGELACVQVQLRKARENIAGLVQMNDLLMTGKAEVEARLAKALEKIGTLEHQYSFGSVQSVKIITGQRDHLLRDNQRLLAELKKFTEQAE